MDWSKTLLLFVETPREPSGAPDKGFPFIALLFWGLFFIDMSAFLFIPVGYYLESWRGFLLLFFVFFLLLVYLGVHLVRQFGYGILISLFLTILSAGIGKLFLADFVRLLLKQEQLTTIIANTEPTVIQSGRFYHFPKFRTVRNHARLIPVPYKKPLVLSWQMQGLHYYILPIQYEKQATNYFLLCPSFAINDCSDYFSPIRGRAVNGTLWDRYLAYHRKDFQTAHGLTPIYFLWQEQAYKLGLSKGVFGLYGLSLLNFCWVFGLVFYSMWLKK